MSDRLRAAQRRFEARPTPISPPPVSPARVMPDRGPRGWLAAQLERLYGPASREAIPPDMQSLLDRLESMPPKGKDRPGDS